jgi:carboxyvinyl-carboxyphosphonate phosphorylmutase
MDQSQARQKFRKILERKEVIYPASVYDPISARIAFALGFEAGIMGGSLASASVLAAPDLIVLTLTELADHVNRTTRAADISLIVDADHGYGNALNVMRTVQELEAAGASALTIEDTALPKPFRQQKGGELITKDEVVGKLKAAVESKRDSELVIIGRSSALQHCPEEAMERIEAYAGAGVDALMVLGATSYEQIARVHHATELPLIVGYVTPQINDLKKLADCGVRVALRGHFSFYVAVQSLYESIKHLKDGGSPEDLKGKMATEEVMNMVFRTKDYKEWQEKYLN